MSNILEETFEVRTLFPFGIALIAKQVGYAFTDLDSDLIHILMATHKVIVIRGLNPPSESTLVQGAEALGSLLAWDFGVVMEMKAQEQPKNYLFTNGPVPFHWDGAFHKEPRYLLFQCIEAPLPEHGGETLFSNTQKIWAAANEDEKTTWATRKIRYQTEKLAHYGGEIHVPLVQTHPFTGDPILRFAEPVPASMLNPVQVDVSDLTGEAMQQWLTNMAQRCYLQENCYEHTWQNNDILLADNFSLIHARRAFKAFSPRFLRRIQIL